MARWSTVFLALAVVAACGDDVTDPSDQGPDDGSGSDLPRDTVAPSVVSTLPLDGAVGVSANAVLRVTFSEPVILRSGGSSGVDLRTGGRGTPGTVRWSSATSIEFSPLYPLDPGASYRAVLLQAVTDTAGNPPDREHEWSFGVEGAPIPDLRAAPMLEHVRALAHDSMRGRFTGSVEELEAARYVRSRFQEIGLEPGAPEYFQTFLVDLEILGEAVESRNVVGVLPGRGELAEEWVVVGAHYDHVGTTEEGEPLNGADDNASGTSMLIELARALAEHVRDGGLGEGDRRSVIFHAFGAEEVGLVGSGYFCRHPTVPMDRIVGMMNLDMVGRLRNRTLSIIGPRPTTLLGSLLPLVNRSGLTLFYDPSLVDRSDQRCFVANGKPVIFLHTGIHPQYHTPFDDWELINGEGMEEVGTLALRALAKLVLRPDPVGDG